MPVRPCSRPALGHPQQRLAVQQVAVGEQRALALHEADPHTLVHAGNGLLETATVEFQRRGERALDEQLRRVASPRQRGLQDLACKIPVDHVRLRPVGSDSRSSSSISSA